MVATPTTYQDVVNALLNAAEDKPVPDDAQVRRVMALNALLHAMGLFDTDCDNRSRRHLLGLLGILFSMDCNNGSGYSALEEQYQAVKNLLF